MSQVLAREPETELCPRGKPNLGRQHHAHLASGSCGHTYEDIDAWEDEDAAWRRVNVALGWPSEDG